MNEVLKQEEISTGVSLFDSGAFTQMAAVASKMAESSLVPQTLRGKTEQETAANCFRVVEQAQRWKLSPFAVMDSASVVHGKLMWEGKLIAAAINSTLKTRLRYEYSGSGDGRTVIVSGDLDGVKVDISGSVKDWKTTGNGSPWKPSQYDQMLAYRGAREWARRHSPEIILGVYAPDELDAKPTRNVTPAKQELPAVRADFKQPEVTTEEEAKPKKTEATGRQKKDRHHRTGEFVSVAEKVSESGKTFFVLTINIGAKTVDLITFSTTLGDYLVELEVGTMIDVTFTVGLKSGQYQLESYELSDKGKGEKE